MVKTLKRWRRRARAAVLTALGLAGGLIGGWAGGWWDVPWLDDLGILGGLGGNRTPQACIVTKVSDGDTLQARCTQGSRKPALHKVRLRAIDAPELRQAYGQQARQALNRLCLGASFTLPPKPRTDQYGRLLLDLECGGVDVAQRMVGTGMAWVYHHEAQRYPALVALQAQARRSGKGLWGQTKPQEPWLWRKQHAR